MGSSLANFDNYNKLTPYNHVQICSEDDDDADRFGALIVNNDVYMTERKTHSSLYRGWDVSDD